jgi:hypothetical protein
MLIANVFHAGNYALKKNFHKENPGFCAQGWLVI